MAKVTKPKLPKVSERCEVCRTPLNGQGHFVRNADVGDAWVCPVKKSNCAARHASRVKLKGKAQ